MANARKCTKKNNEALLHMKMKKERNSQVRKVLVPNAIKLGDNKSRSSI